MTYHLVGPHESNGDIANVFTLVVATGDFANPVRVEALTRDGVVVGAEWAIPNDGADELTSGLVNETERSRGSVRNRLATTREHGEGTTSRLDDGVVDLVVSDFVILVL